MPYVWMDGALVAQADALVPIGTHALHYGTGVFEGIRGYRQEDGSTAIARLGAHVDRLIASGAWYAMTMPFSRSDLIEACWQVLEANDMDAGYLRPIAYRGAAELGVYPLGNPVQVAIMAWPWGAYLGQDAIEHGIRATVSAVRRFGPSVMPPSAKATGQYLNGVLAKVAASNAGFAEALMLNEDGNLSEGSGENVFLVIDSVVVTPAASESILEGITRDSVIRFLRETGHEVQERTVAAREIAAAQEMFVTGTAAEITPIRSVDAVEFGEPGPITRTVQSAYFDAVAGRPSPLAWMMESR